MPQIKILLVTFVRKIGEDREVYSMISGYNKIFFSKTEEVAS